MLGQAFHNLLQKEHELAETGHELDITSLSNVQEFVNIFKPEYIINCAAYTNVDLAEKELDSAININAKGAENISLVSNDLGIRAVHFGSDYIFSGEKVSYTEQDSPRPLNNYGYSKLLGELRWISKSNGLIVRSSWLFSENGNNFVKTMLRLFREREEVRVVNDQLGRPTYAPYLAEITSELLFDPNRPTGIWHVANAGICSWHRFAEDIYKKARELKIIDNEVNIIPVTTAEYFQGLPDQAERPLFSVLETKLVEGYLKKPMKHYRKSLETCLLNIGCK